MQILAAWNWQPSIWIGVALLVGVYLSAIGSLRSRFSSSEPVPHTQAAWFLLGAWVILFALASPLDELNRMTQAPNKNQAA